MFTKIVEKVKEYYIAVLLCMISMLLLNLIFGRVCLMRIFFGIPCPCCGITRAAGLLLTGHIKEAIQMHPLIILVVSSPILILIIKIVLKNYIQFIKYYAILSMIIFIVVYLFRMIQFFPNREPYVYDSSNLVRDVIYIAHKVKTY